MSGVPRRLTPLRVEWLDNSRGTFIGGPQVRPPLARFVKVSQQELDSVRKLYESVMSYACHGLFFREGMVLAEEVTKSLALGEDPLDVGKKVILERGWAEEVSFTASGARQRGAIAAMPGGYVEPWHRVRAIV